jgi:hypothetical protein
VRYETVTVLPSPVTLLALLEGAELGVFKVGCVSSTFQLHFKGQYVLGKVAVRCGALRTLKNSPNVELYGLHGLPLTYFWPGISLAFFFFCCCCCYCCRCMATAYQVFCEPEAQASQ